jgi:uncharacterized protein (DUF2062 family)
MIFGRRNRPALGTRLREFLRPRKSWRRGFRYIGRRVQRLPDTPHRIALGFACGVLASFTPLFTLHFFVAMGLAIAVRANVLAAALGTFFGNPLTFPFIAGISLSLGGRILGSRRAEAAAENFDPAIVFRDLQYFLDRIFWPYLAGGVLPGLACGLASYFLLRPVVAAYQQRRRMKLVEAAAQRVRAGLARGAIKGNPVLDKPEGLT